MLVQNPKSHCLFRRWFLSNGWSDLQLLSLITVASLLLGCQDKEALAPAASKSVLHRVETTFVAERHLVSRLETFGSLEAFQDIEIGPHLAGRIESIAVDEGDPIAQGDVLMVLNSEEASIALGRAQAELEKSRQEFAKLTNGLRPEEIEEARTRHAASQASLDAARDEWERISTLAEQGIASTGELVKAKSAFDVASALHSQSKARLDLALNGSREEDILSAKAEMDVRTAAVNEIKRQVKEHRILAPSAGVISQRLKDAGEWIRSGETGLTLLVLDPMRLRVEAPQSLMPGLQPGMTARVTIPGMDDTIFEATVRRVIPQARPETRNFPVLLELPNPSNRLSSGMYARVEMATDFGVDALVIPRESVQYRDQQLVVFRLTSNSAYGSDHSDSEWIVREIPIEITHELNREVAVRAIPPALLSHNQEIVTMGGTQLKDGDPVQRLTYPSSSPSNSKSSSITRP